jgi:F-box-like
MKDTPRYLMASRTLDQWNPHRWETQQSVSLPLPYKHNHIDESQQLSFIIQVLVPSVSRVPPEILAIIFAVHVHENCQSPWLLMQVSRAWRAAALMTRSIWTRIMLAPSNWTKFQRGVPRVRSLEGMEICFKERQLALALKRAGGMPLDLKTVFYRKANRAYWNWRAGIDLIILLDYIKKHQVNPRLRRLNIGHEIWLSLPPDTFNAFGFADLVSLTISEGDSELINKVVSEARGLRSLFVPASSLVEMRQYNGWHKLEELGISSLWSCAEKEGIRSIVAAATALTLLSLRDGHFNTKSERIHMASLKYLELREFSGFWPVESPNLTHLTLHVLQLYNGSQPGSIRLPCVLEISYYASHQHHAAHITKYTFRAFDVPSLHKLNFHCGYGVDGEKVLRCLWPIGFRILGCINPPISNIEAPVMLFRGAYINPMVLARTLVNRTRLQELSLVAIGVTTEFFERLAPVLTGKRAKKPQDTQQGVAGTWEIPCRALKRLSIDLVGGKIKQRQAVVEASAKRLMAARIKAAVPFELFSIRFSKEQGWTEI